MDSLNNGFTQALIDVIAERGKQDAKWGVQDHEITMWLTILMEEVGEAAKDILDSRHGGSTDGQCGSQEEYRQHKQACYRAEMVQVAAVALAMIECYDRAQAKGKPCPDSN
jgi:hypothetical protein